MPSMLLFIIHYLSLLRKFIFEKRWCKSKQALSNFDNTFFNVFLFYWNGFLAFSMFCTLFRQPCAAESSGRFGLQQLYSNLNE